MRQEWRTVLLKDVLQPKGYIRGPFGSALKRGDMLDTGIPVYEQQHAIYGSRQFRFHISENKYMEMKRFSIQPDDIIISCSGTVGKVSIITKDDPIGIISQALLLLRVNVDIIDPLFLCYFFRSYEGYNAIVSRSSGSVQVNISKREVIEQIPLRLPDIQTQRRIVSILNSLDQKIVCSAKINDNLLQQTAALFAQYYEQASEIVPFTSVIQVLGGGTPKTGNPLFWNGNVPFFTPKDVGTPYTLTTEKAITEDGLAHCNSRLYPVNTVFVTARGTVGKVGMPGVPMAMNQSCYALVGKGIDQLMVYFYTLRTVQALKHKASGAVFDAITTRDFETETIRLIAEDAAIEFLSVATPMFSQILGNSIENQRLTELRDALLPKLMTGEVNVSDIDI